MPYYLLTQEGIFNVLCTIYCRFGNFRENFIFANNIKRHISDVEKSPLRQGLPVSINDRVILPFREGFIFTKLRIIPRIPSSLCNQSKQEGGGGAGGMRSGSTPGKSKVAICFLRNTGI